MKSAKFPEFKTDREAAEYWSSHESTPYVRGLTEIRVIASGPVKKRVAGRRRTRAADATSPRDAVTVRLAPRQIAVLRRSAKRRGMH
jgi:hypothetical protein